MTTRFLTILAVLALAYPLFAHVPLSFDQWEAIDYRTKVERTCNDQIKNHKVRAVHKMWELDKAKYKEQSYSQSDRTAVHGADAWVEVALPQAGAGTSIEYVQYLTPDAQYFMNSEKGKRPYRLETFSTEWKDRQAFTQGFGYFSATRQFYSPRKDEQLVSHEKSTFEGADTIKITTKHASGTNVFLHVLPTSFQLLYAETDRSLDFGSRGTYIPEKTISRVTYREAENKQYPVKFEQHRLQPDGVQRKMLSIEITEYVPYTPTADDLDLEKRFGVKPVAHEPRPESAKPRPPKSSGSLIWYIVGGVLAVFAIGLVFYARRRRAAAE